MSELTKEKIPATTKKVMKYIRIQPSLRHTEFDIKSLEESDYSTVQGDPSFITTLMTEKKDPILSKPIWGQNFKFRFISKKTGRKFDLNITVNDIEQLEKEYTISGGEPDKYSSGKC